MTLPFAGRLSANESHPDTPQPRQQPRSNRSCHGIAHAEHLHDNNIPSSKMNNVQPDPTTSSPSIGPAFPSDSSDIHDTIASCSSTRQQRLLQLRNDHFPTKSSLSLSGRLSGLTTDDGSPPPRNQENIAPARSKGRKYHTTSSLGILAEISNSVRSASLGAHSRDLTNRTAIPIFEDTPRRALLDPSPQTSPPVYHNSSSSPVDSPFRFENIQDSLGMGLREVSGNARKASSENESPWSNGVKSARRRQTTLSARFNSEDYIDRIEKELELANNAVYSPNSNRLWKDKLKMAEAENERLRQELADVKSTFESEIQNAVQHKTAAEVVLRREIRALKDEVEQKNTTIRSMETQHDDKRQDQGIVEALRTVIDRLEIEKFSLEQSNESMSKRNEVLTHLLALSPTKINGNFELGQPVRLSRSNRPQSLLLPRVSSSPTHTHPQRPRSLIGSPASNGGFDLLGRGQSPSSPLSPDHHARALSRPELSRSRSMQTANRSHSRSSTVASYVSYSPSASEHASGQSSVDPTVRHANRRTRRMHGSTQLKPLLLPTLTGEFGALSTSTPVTSPSRLARRDFTDESIDPTKMFISQSPTGYESDAENPLYHSSESKDTARNLAYQSLEGVLDPHDDKSDLIQELNESYFSSRTAARSSGRQIASPRAFYALEGLKSPQSISSGEGDRTLLPPAHDVPESLDGSDVEGDGQLILYSSPDKESGVDIPEPLFANSRSRPSTGVPASPSLSAHDDIDNHGLPVLPGYGRKRRKMSSSSREIDRDEAATVAAQILAPPETRAPSDTADRGVDARSLNGMETPAVRSRPTSMSLLSPRRSRTPLEILNRKNFGVRPIAVVTIKTIYGTLSKCTTMMRDFRKDPLAMARRVIANAWRCNWAVLGKLSWWVLGLFLGPSARNKPKEDDWDWDEYDGEAIADRHCRPKSVVVAEAAQPLLRRSSDAGPARRVRFDAVEESSRSQTSGSSATDRAKPGWGQTVVLWGKFSMAIMLAVGGAVVKGPGEMLKEADMRNASSRSHEQRRVSLSSQTNDVDDTSTTSVELQPVSPSSTTSEVRQRRPRKQSFCSPPPSARAILSHELDSELFSSSPPASSSPSYGSFRFGRGQTFDFTIGDDPGLDVDTLKPRRPGRARVEDFFDESHPATPIKTRPRGNREYDPESAGLGAFQSTASTPDSLKGPGGGWYG